MTKIEWTEQTWNPIVGCSVISPGCTNCYAMNMAARLEAMGQATYQGLTKPSKAGPVWTGKLAQAPEAALFAPLRRKKPTMYFVNSMSDLFHENVPDEWIDRVFAVMALCPQHTFQVLTKRSGRMREYLSGLQAPIRILRHYSTFRNEIEAAAAAPATSNWPLRNCWLGVSTEDQARADERIPDLLATPAAVRFISAEPLLGPIDLQRLTVPRTYGSFLFDALRGTGGDWYGAAFQTDRDGTRLDWVIVGGESGPGARPMHPDWARSLRDQCAAAGVPFFFKQNGEWLHKPEIIDARGSSFHRFGDGTFAQRLGKRAAGRLLDGLPHDAMPPRAAP